MSAFEQPYWNLAQATAWVVWRSRDLVEQFEGVDRHGYRAFLVYRNNEDYPEYGGSQELHDALIQGRLTAHGVDPDGKGRTEAVAAIHWKNLELRPPLATSTVASKSEPWRTVTVQSADMKRLWRSKIEVTGHAKFDWEKVKIIFREIQKANPEFSSNELINETRGEFEERFNKAAPSRTSIQNHKKNWN